MVDEAVKLGFEYMELSHGVRLSLVPGILQAVDESRIKISSVHNFCPLPPGVMGAAPNLYQPTAPSAAEQAMWFRHTLRTIDFAHRVHAELMVIHCGSIRYFWRDPSQLLEKMVEQVPFVERRMSPEYQKMLTKSLERMAKKQGDAYARLVENLKKLVPTARERGIRIGLENREDFNELPMDAEMTRLLNDVGEPDVFGYWHDCGHAQIKERQQITSQERLLSENGPRQWGFHLHDVHAEEEEDHFPPGSGVIDWQLIRRFMRPHHLLVLELSPRTRSAGVRQARDFILQLIGQGSPTLQPQASGH